MPASRRNRNDQLHRVQALLGLMFRATELCSSSSFRCSYSITLQGDNRFIWRSFRPRRNHFPQKRRASTPESDKPFMVGQSTNQKVFLRV